MNLDSNSKVAFYLIGFSNDFELFKINKPFADFLEKNDYMITSTVNELLRYKNIICLVYLGKVKLSEFKRVIFRLQSIPDLNIGYFTIE